MKIRFVCFLLIFALAIAILSACDNTPEDTPSQTSSEETSEIVSDDSSGSETSKHEFDPTPREIKYTEHMSLAKIRDPKYDEYVNYFEMNQDKDKVTYVITSIEEAKTFSSLLHETDAARIDLANNIPDGYFEEKILIVNNFVSKSIGYGSISVEKVSVNENGVRVYYHYEPTDKEIILPAEEPQLFFVEVDRLDVLGCENFSAELDCMTVTDDV